MYTKALASRSLLLIAENLGSASKVSVGATNDQSIKAAAQSVAAGIMGMYQHGTVGVDGTQPFQVGLFDAPYYWWESGAVWGAMIDYWKYTGDKQWEAATLAALNAQVGPNYDYIMPQQTYDEANDDQAFWAFDPLSAHENGFPALPSPTPDYLTLAENVFNEMVGRWATDSQYCGGGLRWQYTPSQSGYNYKNTVSNGGFFDIAARLASATNNQTYAEWAEKIYSWSQQIGFIDAKTGAVFDGAALPDCNAVNGQQWSYNAALYLHGAAVMYNYTSSHNDNAAGSAQTWQSRAESIMGNAGKQFFGPFPNSTDIMYEPLCEESLRCNSDRVSFKAYLSRFMAKSSQVAPFLQSQVTQLLTASAKGAMSACTNLGNAGQAATCGEKWYVGQYEGPSGLGQQLAVLETVQALLMI